MRPATPVPHRCIISACYRRVHRILRCSQSILSDLRATRILFVDGVGQ